MASCSVLCGHRAQGGCQHHSGAEMLFPSQQPTPSTLPGDPPNLPSPRPQPRVTVFTAEVRRASVIANQIQAINSSPPSPPPPSWGGAAFPC